MTPAPSLPPLTSAAFAAMVQAAHAYAPFPWQRRLAVQAAAGNWPEAIDIPTGLGKTTTLDAAVFALAAQAERPLGERTAPLRIWYVIDRRLVVDDVAAHAHRLAEVLARSADPAVTVIAERLRAYSGIPAGQPPLHVVSLRGGQFTNPDWATRLDIPMVIVSTIDQFGSRLLWRGYGVPPRRWPLHAAFAGTDSLILLDEAHLAAPLLDTLQRLSDVPAEQPVTRSPRVVVMSATPRAGTTQTLSLEPEDRAHPVVGQRLRARKLVRLADPVATRADLAHRLAALARAATGRPGVRVVGVVANRVSVARAVRERLAKLDPEAEQDGRVLLLTARQRPTERQTLIDAVHAHAGASHTRQSTGPVCYLVATQTVEVGVDLDTDALVTESCPLDALIQRIGRLDRRGQFLEFQRDLGITTPEAAIVDVVFCPQLDGSRDNEVFDKVYGAVNQATWEWLTTQHSANGGVLNLGLAGLEQIPPAVRAQFTSTAPHAPVLTPAHLRAWVHTSPPPALDPAVAPFLHGISESQAEVHLAWRADLTDHREHWVECVDAHPPRAHELLPLPLWEARRWLAGDLQPPAADADLDQVATPSADRDQPRPPQRRQPITPPRPAVVVHNGQPRLLDATQQPGTGRAVLNQLVPGDVIVCPVAAGGADQFGWNPVSTRPVDDVADHHLEHPAGVRLRLDPAVLHGGHDQGDTGHSGPDSPVDVLVKQAVEVAAAPDLSYSQARDGLLPLLDNLQAVLAPPLAEVAAALAAAGKRLEWRLDRHPDRVMVTTRATHRGWTLGETGADATSLTTEVLLRTHGDAVGDRARHTTRRLQLPLPVSRAVELAARHHDDGKAHPTMQRWLHGVSPDWHDEVLASGRVLAKSNTPYLQRAATRRIAQVPNGWRHEAISAALLQRAVHLHDLGIDLELVAHLAGAHHGHARPLFPALPAPDHEQVVHTTINGQAVSVRGNPLQGLLDDTWVEAFNALNHRYGPWGLALLEGLVISADITCSQEGT